LVEHNGNDVGVSEPNREDVEYLIRPRSGWSSRRQENASGLAESDKAGAGPIRRDNGKQLEKGRDRIQYYSKNWEIIYPPSIPPY